MCDAFTISNSFSRLHPARTILPFSFIGAASKIIYTNSNIASEAHAFHTHSRSPKEKSHGDTTDTTRLYSSSSSSMDMDGGIPEDYPNLEIIQIALSAIRKACKISTYLQPTTVQSDISGITKKDASPVTIGDFAAQAIVLNLLERELNQKRGIRDNVFIAEEGSSNLSEDLSQEIMSVLKECGMDGMIENVEELSKSIDLGQTYKPNGELLDSIFERFEKDATGSPMKVWCLDPIDGTRGFLRGKREGGQYCIALALIEDGVPIVGLLGCPNLPTSRDDENYEWSSDETEENNASSRGCIFVASKGGGCYQLPLYPSSTDGTGHDADASTIGASKVHVTANDGSGGVALNQARFCVGVEQYGDPEGKVSAIANKIHGKLDDDGDILFTRRMDSQVKYGVLARGGAEIMTRLPKKSYVEWIWDHAAGRIVIEEAGGNQVDTNGNLVDYGRGAKMDKNVDGLLVSSGGIFSKALLDAYTEQESERN
eukprot:CAMPEP_0197248582 /NCGR_PEP_ID=MMETSP1429-20130617/40577_1 /TAXON_ID=49237 /ORGANISM="Chaetoceros  sp., Strain UNC1202" /LENGTH=484 /DNA_ID=CAMNT_0042709853 /DNA_START=295 /DNA_END=1749 /DNA_ORIENTATION=-